MKYRNDVQLKIIFTLSNGQNGIDKRVVHHLAALNHAGNREIVENAVKQFYSKSVHGHNYSWMDTFPADYNEHTITVVEKQRQWCNSKGISSVPAILINGYKLPPLYDIKDLKYLL